MKLVATSCFNAKNRLCNRTGLSPLQAVTGKNNVLPQSIIHQLCAGQVGCTINDELEVRDALRRAERIRAAAVDSFNWVDSSEVIRKALNCRSRPPKLDNLQEGMTVYVHEPPPSRRGQHRRLQDHASWDGPGLVVCVEKREGAPRRVWVRLRAKVRSFSLEKIRLATPDEMLGSQFVIQALDDVMKDIKEGKLVLEENKRRSVLKPATPAPPGAHRRGASMDSDYMLDDQEAQLRVRQVRRMEMMNDVPHSDSFSASSPLQQLKQCCDKCGIGAWPTTGAAYNRKNDKNFWRRMTPCRLTDGDEERDQEMTEPERQGPSSLAFHQKKKIFEEMAARRKASPRSSQRPGCGQTWLRRAQEAHPEVPPPGQHSRDETEEGRASSGRKLGDVCRKD